MSTKTTFKRVALVTVAALGFGVMSVVPSNAAINADTLTLSSATAAQNTAETQTATSAVVTQTFLGLQDDSASVTASLISGPAGNTALPYLSITETASAVSGSGGALAKGDKTNPNIAAVVRAASSSAVTTVKYAVYLGSTVSTPPTVAGTYVVRLAPASVGSSGALVGSSAQTLTIVVTAAPTLDTVAKTGTAFLRLAEDSATVTTDAVVTASRTIPSSNPGTTAVANIAVTLKNAAGTTLTTSVGESYTATIAGPGTLGSGTWTGNGVADLNADYRGRAITVKIGDAVAIYPDGNSGVATVTISTAAGIVIGTKSVTFFGDATSVVASANAVVLNPNTLNNGDGSDITTRPIMVVVKDSAGTSVSNASLRVTSETLTIVSDSYASNCGYDNASSAYYCSLNALVAGKTNITVGTKTSATATTGINAAPVAVRVGTQTAASVTVTTDKASYVPGEKATVTVQLKDANGDVNADGVYTNIFATGGIMTDILLGTGSDTMTATGVSTKTGGVAVAGKITYTIYMPVHNGPIKFSYKTAGTAVTGTAPSAQVGLAVANQAVTSSFEVTVSNTAFEAATAAAEEATAAANDATDAALSAAEAAEAATAMAQEAVDAVAELSASVTKLISALRAQITTLTNLVVKIQKKVRA